MDALSWLALAFHVLGLGHEIKETDFVEGKLTAIATGEAKAGTGAAISKEEKDTAKGAGSGSAPASAAVGGESAAKPSRRRVRRSVRRRQGRKREDIAIDQDLD